MATMTRRTTAFRPQCRSRHDTHAPLRTELPLMPFRSVIRLGSTTEMADTVANGGTRIEINSAQGVRNSANKLLMKQCFEQAGVNTADWWTFMENDATMGILFYDNSNWQNKQQDLFTGIGQLPYPIVAKHIYGSRGTGNHLLQNADELTRWMQGKELGNYIFEKFYNFNREYRMHVSQNGCFYTCRKMLKSDTPDGQKWFRNDSNSVWIVEDNELFNRPVNWVTLVAQCQQALTALGLDFAAFDVRIQSSNDRDGNRRENPEFIIIESNSAPSFGAGTLAKYLVELPRLLQQKHQQLNA